MPDEKLQRRLKVLLGQREMYFARIQSLYEYGKKLQDPASLKYFMVKFKTLEPTKLEFLKTVTEINEVQVEMEPEKYIPDFKAVESFDDLYCHILNFAEQANLQKSESSATIKTETTRTKAELSSCTPVLPKISLPTFSGNIKEWPVFYECFKSLIGDNDKLTDVDKVNYLVGQLSGRAATVCAGLPPVGSNYKIIWDALIEKYQNVRVLANSYLEQILELKPATSPSANNLNNVLDKCNSSYKALEKLNISNLTDFVFAYLLLSKLDNETKTFFENTYRKSTVPSYGEVLKFVKEQAQIYALTPQKTGVTANNKVKTHSFFVSNKVTNGNCCLLCHSKQHNIFLCSKFLSLSPLERYKLIKSRNLCILCFGEHKSVVCKSKLSCKTCGYKHNTLLHFISNKSSKVSAEDQTSSDSQLFYKGQRVESSSDQTNSEVTLSGTSSALCSTVTMHNTSSVVLLSTAFVNILDKFGETQKARFLLDSGSQAHFITKECADRLQLDIIKCNLPVKSIGSGSKLISGRASTVVSSRLNPEFYFAIDCFLIESISDRLPEVEVNNNAFLNLLDLPLADETFYVPGKIDGIIGAELFPAILGSRRIASLKQSPVAVETKFGYVVMGSVPAKSISDKTSSFHISVENNSTLDRLVAKFWELEDIPKQSFCHPDDTKCEEIYCSTVSRETSGRYVVSLPFKENPNKLGDSYMVALKRLLALENKFSKNPLFKDQYQKVIKAHIVDGYMALVEDDKLSFPHYFIPHHAVYKADSVSTPLRCVFDASAKTSSGVSLNDILYTGPKLQADVFDIFLNFRLFAIAFTADIRQMYLRIGMCSNHKRFQNVLWRFSEKDPIGVYQLNTVTFGVTSSPFLALRTIRQLADDERQHFPLASNAVFRDFYMDDFISSVESIDAARELYQQLVALFKKGQFHLTKWAINSEELLQEIPVHDRSPKVVDFNKDGLKILGLQWYPKTDVFKFKINAERKTCTKRNVLSAVARLFDPLGFLAPVTLLIKLIIKKLWSLNLGWDDIANYEMSTLWKTVQLQLELLNEFEIPRHINVDTKSSVMLVGFCDACLDSYGAVVYLRCTNINGEVNVSLVCSKTKVAPMKVQTIPRLELCAAHLLAKLLNAVESVLISRIKIEKSVALSDSTVALCWIASAPYRWQTFVANRVAKIQELVSCENWFFVEGRINVSDYLSRGLTPAQLLDKCDWIAGPQWLKSDFSSWPVSRYTSTNDTLPEQRVTTVLTVITEIEHPLHALINRSSSWIRLLRVTVYVLRFLKIISRSKNCITVSDLDKAELTLIKIVQWHHFKTEIISLEKHGTVSSKLRSLSPFLSEGIIRVGGRLSNSPLEFDRKHPYLLPKNDNLVKLIIDDCHRRNLHTGPYLVSSILRQRFWIIGARNVIRFHLAKCNNCFKLNPKSTFPKMADLPTVRVTEAKPFLHCGVDYGGPFFVNLSRRRGAKSQKAYLCLFICLTTKALHLELASDLSTETFLLAFKRFLARRGVCSVMYSDCGTNFIGAKNELNLLFELINSEKYNNSIQEELAYRKIEWKFQPPASPHFGGIWEANIKAVKTHLNKVIGLQVLTYEELLTALTQIEAVLNSRPLCWLSTDPSDPLPLTPAHFLTMTPLKFIPAADVPDTSRSILERKRLLDHMVQSFWKRWQSEYLSQLQVRQKWNTSSPSLQKGTLVILKQDNLPPLQWPVGVIMELFPGNDGVVRVVTVKTKTGIYKRPVVRLCPLPSQ